jgi:phosphatidate cytidylyltransferase
MSRAADLGLRTFTAVIMGAVAGFALWMGGMAWTVFVLLIGVGVWFEWSNLCVLGHPPGRTRTLWRYGGAVYCGLACAVLLALRDMDGGEIFILMLVGAVIGTDVGAYAFGRAIGGPKIAPSISPSKTWAGLFGGVFGAALALALVYLWIGDADFRDAPPLRTAAYLLVMGALIAVLAQIGDFFESWMKRKAGVKDSGNLLPGHGGLFDRVDGLLLVLVVIGNFILIARIAGFH